MIDVRPTAPSTRRLDWRFLLPVPPQGFRRLVLLGGTPEMASALLSLGSAREVSLEPQAGADALAVLDGYRGLWPDLRELESAGAVYWEVNRRRTPLLTPGRIRRLLRAAGLPRSTSYWVAPNFGCARRYVPLEVDGPLRWYLRTLYPRGGRGASLIRPGLLRLGRRWGSLAPCVAVVAGGNPALLEPLGLPGSRPLLLTSGIDDGSRVVVLPFVGDDESPALVAKASRTPRFNLHTENEQETLQALQALPGIPRPLGTAWLGDLAIGMESVAPGRPLSAAHASDDPEVVSGWLSSFHRATARHGRWDAAPLSHLFDAYAEQFGLSPAVAGMFARARDRSAKLQGLAFPSVTVHNDFGPWNVYRDGTAVTVIDWEYGRQGERTGWPLCDLLYFNPHWAYVSRRHHSDEDQLACFARLARGDGPESIERAVRRYLEEMGINTGFLPVLTVATWVQRALEAAERATGLSRPSAAETRFRQYVDLLAAESSGLWTAA